MAKRTRPAPSAADDALEQERTAPPVATTRDVAVFPGFDETPEPEGMRVVTLIGGGPHDGMYRLPHRIPQNVARGRHIYNLSDRAAGVYLYRVP